MNTQGPLCLEKCLILCSPSIRWEWTRWQDGCSQQIHTVHGCLDPHVFPTTTHWFFTILKVHDFKYQGRSFDPEFVGIYFSRGPHRMKCLPAGEKQLIMWRDHWRHLAVWTDTSQLVPGSVAASGLSPAAAEFPCGCGSCSFDLAECSHCIRHL